MIVAVNGRMLSSGRLDGIGWYAHELLQRLIVLRPDDHFVIVADRPFDDTPFRAGNTTVVVAGPPTRHPVLWHWWTQSVLPRTGRRHGAEAYLSFEGFIPLGATVPTVAVLHDMSHVTMPEQVSAGRARYYQWMYRRCVQAATRLGTVSETARGEICEHYHLAPEAVTVVPNGVRTLFAPLAPEAAAAVRTSVTGGRPYVLFVGTVQPRKNLERLIRAFAALRTTTSDPIALVIAGHTGWKNDAVHALIGSLGIAADVVLPGYVDDDRLRQLYGAAELLAFVPLFEGFGVPVIEAMACGTPVVASAVSSVPEVGGDAAVYVDPYDVPAITQAMERLLTDRGLRAACVARGFDRATYYSWDRSARRLSSLLDEAMARHAPSAIPILTNS